MTLSRILSTLIMFVIIMMVSATKPASETIESSVVLNGQENAKDFVVEDKALETTDGQYCGTTDHLKTTGTGTTSGTRKRIRTHRVRKMRY